MKNLHLYATAAISAALALLGPSAHAVVRSTHGPAPKLPEIWEQAGPQARIQATRAAELDADRLLIERLYGVNIDSETSVGEFATRNDSILGGTGALLLGSVVVGESEYFDDGRVEVVKKVEIEQLIETVRKKTKEKLRSDGTTETVAFDENTELSTSGKTLEVMGNAALPGSEGHQKVMAKRAAELDAYRKLAQRMMGIRIDSETTVRSACLESDKLVADLSRLVKGAEPVSIRYLDDGSCEVEMSLRKQDILRAVSNHQKGRKRTTRIEDSISEKVLVEKGRGSMHPAQMEGGDAAEQSAPTPTTEASVDMFFETETIIRRLLESKPVQR